MVSIERAALAAVGPLAGAAVLGFLLAAVPPPAAKAETAEPPALGLPIRCRPGHDCWLVNLVDLDPGPGTLDYRCGKRTYNGHKGTDIAIRDSKAMARGVEVVASAPGVVKAPRDGMEDVDFTRPGVSSVKGRECGNGVVIRHGGGWETQYCHLRQGSVAVKKGDAVIRGQTLGLVGNSGKAQFPHVHLSLRHRGEVIDPFVRLTPRGECGPGAGRRSLWREGARAGLDGPATAVYSAGFATTPPAAGDAYAGRLDAVSLPADAPALVFWVSMFGVEAGDAVTLRLTGPGDKPVFENRTRLEKAQARHFRYAGRKRRTPAWPLGTYRGEATLVRGEGPAAETFAIAREIEIR
ncbi:MAG: M23 family metallopeptidase [Rhodospirillales bacterium]